MREKNFSDIGIGFYDYRCASDYVDKISQYSVIHYVRKTSPIVKCFLFFAALLRFLGFNQSAFAAVQPCDPVNQPGSVHMFTLKGNVYRYCYYDTCVPGCNLYEWWPGKHDYEWAQPIHDTSCPSGKECTCISQNTCDQPIYKRRFAWMGCDDGRFCQSDDRCMASNPSPFIIPEIFDYTYNFSDYVGASICTGNCAGVPFNKWSDYSDTTGTFTSVPGAPRNSATSCKYVIDTGQYSDLSGTFVSVGGTCLVY
ncbi:MAG: hypothetical protein LBJ73_02990 [Rickettsiales bacterium]|jgi:hypothetical protein|nr:hypothetical protein [Rickettsiales bacterium]